MKFFFSLVPLFIASTNAGPAEIKDAMLKIYENMFFNNGQIQVFRGLNGTIADVGGYWEIFQQKFQNL